MKYEIIIYIIVAVAALFALAKLPKLYHAFIVPEGYVALLYRNGKFVEQLAPGRHARWGRNVTLELADTRKAFLAVASQEVLTADNVGLKLSLFVTYQVNDPVKAKHETQNWYSDVYNVAQVALRAVIAATPVEALLGNRLDISGQLLARVQPETAKIGVGVHAVEVKDVMFSGELKRAFADVLKAKQEGQAALERARGESAALRNLANAARVLEGNPALLNLRVLQSLSTVQNAGNTLVLGMPGGFVPLKNGKAVPAQDEPHAGET